MPNLHIDETLEAVALVLRDLKTEYDGRLGQISEDRGVEEKKVLARLADVSASVSAELARMAAYRQQTEGFAEETRQRVDTVADRLRDDMAARVGELRAAVESLQEKTTRVEILEHKTGAAGEGLAAVNSALDRLTGQLDDVRAGQQAVSSQLAEMDGKAATQEELDELRRSTANRSEWCTATEALEGRISGLDGQIVELRRLDQETQELFQRIGGECEALAESQVQYRAGIDAELSGTARKEDVDAVQELLAESMGEIAELRARLESTGARFDEAVAAQQVEAKEVLEDARGAFTERLAEVYKRVTELRQQIVEGLGAELRAAVDARVKVSDQMLVDQAERFIAKLSENIRGERGPVGYVSRVQRWVEDYEFPEFALVQYRSGLWQALRATMEHPRVGEGSDWQLVAAGIDDATITPDETAPGGYRLALTDSVGRAHVVQMQIPLPRFLKTWEEGLEYRHYDSVMEDGHRWLATRDNPSGPPSRSDDWVLVGMRGARGARGAKGDRGLPGPLPDMDEVLDAYNRRLLDTQGTPIASYRGSWRYGADYRVGDFLRGEGQMLLCRQAHRAERPPTGGSTDQWEVLFALPQKAAEGGAATQELLAQVQQQSSQIALLAAQVADLTAQAGQQ